MAGHRLAHTPLVYCAKPDLDSFIAISGCVLPLNNIDMAPPL